MGNYVLTFMPLVDYTDRVPPFLPTLDMDVSDRLVTDNDSGTGFFTSKDYRDYPKHDAHVQCGDTERIMPLKRDFERGASQDVWQFLTHEKDNTVSATSNPSDKHHPPKSGILLSYAKNLFDYVYDGLAFSEIQLIYTSRIFVYQRALCFDLNCYPHVNPALHECMVSVSQSGVEGRPPLDMQNPIKTKPLEMYNDTYAPESPFRGGIDPLSDEKPSKREGRTSAFLPSSSLVLVKSYRFPMKENLDDLKKVAERLMAVKAAISWDLCPNILTHFRIDAPVMKMPAITRLWIYRTLYEIASDATITQDERYWIIFQMISSVAELHACGIFHGSISMSNFLISDSGHLFLADVGSCYKPYSLCGSDAAFAAVTTFFESPEYHQFEALQRRKGCYLSPERFYFNAPDNHQHPSTVPNEQLDHSNENRSDTLFSTVCAADIFSLGCCIIELCTNGEPAFTFPDILDLAKKNIREDKKCDVRTQSLPHTFLSDSMLNAKQPQYSMECPRFLPQSIFACLDDPRVVQLVTSMCSPDPFSRLTATDCLSLGRSTGVFPESFFSVLLPLSNVLLHPFFQSANLSSFFFHNTLIDTLPSYLHEGSQYCGKEHIFSGYLDPISFYQALTSSMRKLPLWAQHSQSHNIALDTHSVQRQPMTCFREHSIPNLYRDPEPKSLSRHFGDPQCQADAGCDYEMSSNPCVVRHEVSSDTLLQSPVRDTPPVLQVSNNQCRDGGLDAVVDSPNILNRHTDIPKLQHTVKPPPLESSLNCTPWETVTASGREESYERLSFPSEPADGNDRCDYSSEDRLKLLDRRNGLHRTTFVNETNDVILEEKTVTPHIHHVSHEKQVCNCDTPNPVAFGTDADVIDVEETYPQERKESIRKNPTADVGDDLNKETQPRVLEECDYEQINADDHSTKLQRKLNPLHRQNQGQGYEPHFFQAVSVLRRNDFVSCNESVKCPSTSLADTNTIHNEKCPKPPNGSMAPYNKIENAAQLQQDAHSTASPNHNASPSDSLGIQPDAPSFMVEDPFESTEWNAPKLPDSATDKGNNPISYSSLPHCDSLFNKFMAYWKCDYYARNLCEPLSPCDTASSRKWISSLPLPKVTIESGSAFSKKLLECWKLGYNLHCHASDIRVDRWEIADIHQGVFYFPSETTLSTLRTYINAVYQDLFVTTFELNTSDALTRQAAHCFPRDDASGIYFLNILLTKLRLSDNTQQSVCHYLSCLFKVVHTFSISSDIYIDRVLPLLLSLLGQKQKLLVMDQAFFLITCVLRLCSPQWAPFDYLFKYLFPCIYELFCDERPRCCSMAMEYSPICFDLLSDICLQYIDTPYADLCRLQALNFFRSLLTHDIIHVRIALLRSVGEKIPFSFRQLPLSCCHEERNHVSLHSCVKSKFFPCIFTFNDLTTTILPFLISFMNSTESLVRVVFCLCIFHLLDHIVFSACQSQTAYTIPRHSNDVWSIASALLPCFESVLFDADELVIEAALEGLIEFFTGPLRQWLDSIRTLQEVAPVVVLREQQRWRLMVRQLTQKACPLLYHPNVGIATASRYFIQLIMDVVFTNDPVTQNVYLSALSSRCPYPDKKRHRTFTKIIKRSGLTLPRNALYTMAVRYHHNSAGALGDSFMGDMAILYHTYFESFLKQALKPALLYTLYDLGLFVSKSTRDEESKIHDEDAFKSAIDLLNSEKDTFFLDKYTYCSTSLPFVYQAPRVTIGSSVSNPQLSLCRENDLWESSQLSLSCDSPCLIEPTQHSLLECLLADWFAYNVQPYDNEDAGKLKLQFYVKSTDTPYTTFQEDQAVLRPWVYRDWRARCLRLPFFGYGMFVNDVSFTQTSLGTVSSTVTEGPYSKPLFSFELNKTHTTAFSFPLTPHAVFSCPLYIHSSTHALQWMNSFLDFSLQRDQQGNTTTVQVTECLRNPLVLSKPHDDQRATLPQFKEKEPNCDLVTSHEYNPSPLWRPQGVLVATIYAHTTIPRATNGCNERRLTALHLELTKDARLLVAGTKRSDIDRPLRKRVERCIVTVYDGSKLVAEASNACVDVLTFCEKMAPSSFTLTSQPPSIVLGTYRGSVGTYRLDHRKTEKEDALSSYDNNEERSALDCQQKKMRTRSAIVAITALEWTLETLCIAAHENGRVSCWDFRCPMISSVYSIPWWMGQPTQLLASSLQHTLHVATLGGYLASIDLRYRCPSHVLRITLDKKPVPLVSLSPLSTFHPHGVCVSLASPNNDLCGIDPFTGAIDWGFTSCTSSGSAMTKDSYSHESRFSKMNDCLNDSLLKSYDASGIMSNTRSMLAPAGMETVTLLEVHTVDPGYLYTAHPPCSTAEPLSLGNVVQNTNVIWTTDLCEWRDSWAGTTTALGTPVITAGTDRSIRYLSTNRPIYDSYLITTPYDHAMAVYAPVFEWKASNTGSGSTGTRFKPNSQFFIERCFLHPSPVMLTNQRLKEAAYTTKHYKFVQGSGSPSCPATDALLASCSPGTLSTPLAHYDANSHFIEYRSEPMYSGHQDAITALTVIPPSHSNDNMYTKTEKTTAPGTFKEDMPIIVTGGRDGQIKMWQ